MKRLIIIIFAIAMVFVAACGAEEIPKNIKPEISQMKAICELAVMECYYHDVAKFTEKEVSGALWWKKDKHFWVEYEGIVKLGIDASLLNIVVNDTTVSITLPEAQVLSCVVNSKTLTKESYIVDKDSAKIEAEDEVFALNEAKTQMQQTAENDSRLLMSAKERVQTLLTEYINNIGNLLGIQYEIVWINA